MIINGVSFTYAEAITRLDSGGVNAFQAGLSADDKLQYVNEALDIIFKSGQWPGLTEEISTTSTGGVITLAATYLRLNGLRDASSGYIVPIRPGGFLYSSGGPRVGDVTLYSDLIAIDIGDASGLHKYQLTGNATQLDAMSFKAFVRKRYAYATNTATTVAVDNFQALREVVRYIRQREEQAIDISQDAMNTAISSLNDGLQEFEPDMKQVNIQPSFGMGSFPFVH